MAANFDPDRTALDLSDLTLPDHDGRAWRVSDHRDRPVLLVVHRHLM